MAGQRQENWKITVLRRGSAPVSTVLRKSVRYFIKKKNFPENGLDNFSPSNFQALETIIIFRRFVRLHPRRMELANMLSKWLRNPGMGTLGPVQSNSISWESMPRDSALFRRSVRIYPRSAPGTGENLTILSVAVLLCMWYAGKVSVVVITSTVLRASVALTRVAGFGDTR